MCALTALSFVYCVASTKQSLRLQTGLPLRDRNATITSKWKGSYDSDRKYRLERMGETFVLFRLSELLKSLLGRTRSRSRCGAAIRLSHRPELSDHAVHGEVDG